MKLKIRTGNLSELIEIQKLFYETITSVCKKDYNQDQINVWKSAVENTKRWQNIIQNQYFIVAELENKIVGFASLDTPNYIDVLFVHKDFQRKGIAQRLFVELENEAKRLKCCVLTSDVSKTAKSFFESNGFNVVKEQIQLRKNIELINYRMEKELWNSNL